MSNPILSITLAAFNVEEFIKESIDSILDQTFTDFELICVDDASNDSTADILKEYAKKDNRINLILNTENEGLAVARNKSLTLAKGKYITFLDGDDIYDLSLFKKSVDLAEKEQSDMVLWDYVTFYKNDEIQTLKEKPSELLNLDVSDKVALLQRPSFTWVKLLRTEKVRAMNIEFPKGLTRQDIPVHWHLITELTKISILPERLAYYRQQPNATTAKKDARLFHLVYVMDIVGERLNKQSKFIQYKEAYYSQQLNFFQGMYDNIDTQFKDKALTLIKERLTEDHLIFLKISKKVRPQAKNLLEGISGNRLSYLKHAFWRLKRKIYRLLKGKM